MDPDNPAGAILARAEAALDAARKEWSPRLAASTSGRIASVGEGIARVTGLEDAWSEEGVLLEGAMGLVFDLDPDGLGVALLEPKTGLAAGGWVRRTGRSIEVPVGEALLGRVIDPLGRPLDGKGPVRAPRRGPIECEAPAILDRAPVTVPLPTGIVAIDALVPIGRGQRELILGDRQTGKSALAVDAILNQKETDVIGVYCAIGQRSASVARIIGILRDRGMMERSVVVVAHGDDPPGLRYIAPYAATAMAESFMRDGGHALIAYDDLTAHARAYRELSLLFRRPPGREAFPGDIFYVHARLLERATQLRQELGGGSLTALPILETEAESLSAYIPTNLISITDGQILLSGDLFRKGILPAVDVGRSVSRIGGKASLPALSDLAGDLKLAYSQFLELESFARFGTRLDISTRKAIERGRRIRECLKQPQSEPWSGIEQVFLVSALVSGNLDGVPLESFREAKEALKKACLGLPETLKQAIREGKDSDRESRKALDTAARNALEALSRGNGP